MSGIALPRQAPLGRAIGERLLSDERLAQRVAQGSERAFAILCERHAAALGRYCRSILRNEDDAQDALQNALMHAYTALRASERDVAVRPWLFRIVHNEAISLVRRRRPESAVLDEHLATLGGVAETVEERERLATLVADIKTLSERQRAALVMRELSGLSIDEIADALATTPGAAKQTLFEARCALHKLAEGRAMECDAVRRTISERDGRLLRGRALRAHLRACAGCRDFGALIEARGADLRMLVPPLPTAAIGGLLAHVLGGAGGGHAGAAAGAAGVSAASLGSSATTASLSAKALTALVIGSVGITAAAETAEVATRHRTHAGSPAVTRAIAHAPGAGARVGGSAGAGPSGGPTARSHPPAARAPAAGGRSRTAADALTLEPAHADTPAHATEHAAWEKAGRSSRRHAPGGRGASRRPADERSSGPSHANRGRPGPSHAGHEQPGKAPAGRGPASPSTGPPPDASQPPSPPDKADRPEQDGALGSSKTAAPSRGDR